MGTSVAWDAYAAVLFDLDGVLTPTEQIHARAWKTMFDEFLERRADGSAPFDLEVDYRRHLDGKPRYDGVAAFLASRGIELEWGTPEDAPTSETVCGLGNRKNEIVRAVLASEGVTPYPGSVRFLTAIRSAGLRTAVVSSSANAAEVLKAAGLGDFDAVVTGADLARLGLAGKPAPDAFLEAARRLRVDPRQTVVVEDAVAGVQAGRAGGFGLVVGVDRRGDPEPLLRAGADLVVSDLVELVDDGP